MSLLTLLEDRVDFLRNQFLASFKFMDHLDQIQTGGVDAEADPDADPEEAARVARAKMIVTINKMVSEWSLKFPKLKPEQQKPVSDQISLAVFNALAAFDPDPKRRHLQWMIGRFLAKDYKLEDLGNVQHYLAQFMQMKRMHMAVDRAAQIQNYPTLHDLYAFVRGKRSDKFTGGLVDLEYEAKMFEECIVWANNPAFWIVTPKTKQASQFFGRGSEWCTAWGAYGDTRGNLYDSYASKGDIYIITLHDTGTRYQFQFESGEFRNELDKMVDPNIVWDNYPAVYDAFLKIRKVGKYAASRKDAPGYLGKIGQMEFYIYKIEPESKKGTLRCDMPSGVTTGKTTRHSIFAVNHQNDSEINFTDAENGHRFITHVLLRAPLRDVIAHHSREFVNLLNGGKFFGWHGWSDYGVYHDDRQMKFGTIDDLGEQVPVAGLPEGWGVYGIEVGAHEYKKPFDEFRLVGEGAPYVKLVCMPNGEVVITYDEDFEDFAYTEWIYEALVKRRDANPEQVMFSDEQVDAAAIMTDGVWQKFVREFPLIASYKDAAQVSPDLFVTKLCAGDPPEKIGEYYVLEEFDTLNELIEEHGDSAAKWVAKQMEGDGDYREFDAGRSIDWDEFDRLFRASSSDFQAKLLQHIALHADEDELPDGDLSQAKPRELFAAAESIEHLKDRFRWIADDVLRVDAEHEMYQALQKAVKAGPYLNFSVDPQTKQKVLIPLGADNSHDNWVMAATAQDILDDYMGKNKRNPRYESLAAVELFGTASDGLKDIRQMDSVKVEVDEPQYGWGSSYVGSTEDNMMSYVEIFEQRLWEAMDENSEPDED